MNRTIVAFGLLCVAGIVALVWVSGRQAETDPRMPALDLAGAPPALVEAVERSRSELNSDLRSANAWGRFGMVLGANGYYEHAALCFEHASRFDPSSFKWEFLKGFQYFGLGRIREASLSLRKSESLAENGADRKLVLFYLSYTYVGAGQLEDAAWVADQLDTLEADSALAIFIRGRIASAKGDRDEAVRLLQKVAAHPFLRQRVCEHLAVFFDPATGKPLTSSESCARLPPDEPWPSPIMTEFMAFRVQTDRRIDEYHRLLIQGRTQEASAYLISIADQRPDSETLLLLGSEHRKAGKFHEAEQSFRRSLGFDSSNPRTLLALAECEFDLRRYEDAAKTAEASLAKQGNSSQAHLLRARAYSKLMQFKKAVEALRDAVACKPEAAEIHIELGEALAAGGEVEAAIESFENAVRLAPENPKAKAALESWKARRKI